MRVKMRLPLCRRGVGGAQPRAAVPAGMAGDNTVSLTVGGKFLIPNYQVKSCEGRSGERRARELHNTKILLI